MTKALINVKKGNSNIALTNHIMLYLVIKFCYIFLHFPQLCAQYHDCDVFIHYSVNLVLATSGLLCADIALDLKTGQQYFPHHAAFGFSGSHHSAWIQRWGIVGYFCSGFTGALTCSKCC